MALTVRSAVLGDEAEMGEVHVRAWLAAYRGLIPDAYLDSLTAEQRVGFWYQVLSSDPQPGFFRLVAEIEGGSVVGFIFAGPAAGDADAVQGQVYALNVDPDHWGNGVGFQLLDAGSEALAACGYRTAILWVHPDNRRARGFYEAHGWSDDGLSRREDVMGVEVPEARYSCALDYSSA